MREPVKQKLYGITRVDENDRWYVNLAYYDVGSDGDRRRCKGRTLKVDYANIPKAIYVLQREFNHASRRQAQLDIQETTSK